MEHCDSEAVVAFDTLYTNNHIQILKVLLPYFDSGSRKNLAVLIKFMELQYTMEYFSRHPSALCAASCDPKQPDIAEIFEQIKNFCTPSEKAVFEQLANMKKSMEMYEELLNMMQLFEQFSPGNGPDGFSGVPESGDGPGQGDGPADQTPFGSANPMDLLKGMLSPEQQAMFELFQSSMGGCDGKNS